MKKILTAAALALLTAAPLLSTAATAQELPVKYGDYWDVTGVTVEDQGTAAYLDFLAGEWKKRQEFAKSKGWISGYHVLSNMYKRAGEPDLYLVTIYSRFPSGDEQTQRDRESEAFFKTTVRQALSESGVRAKFRKVISSELFGELLLK